MLTPAPESFREKLHTTGAPATPKPAATIVLLREGADGLEAFLMRRQTSMAFAAGMYVFPGGGVHKADREELPWIGPDSAWFAERFHSSVEVAHEMVVAAARETFEETGVLLAGPDAHSVVSDTGVYHEARAALERHEFTFAEFLHAEQLMLRADLLAPWAHWITPAFEPRRFDTCFFVALVPEGQQIESVSGEADRSEWVSLREALRRVEAREAMMMPPTKVVCAELLEERVDSLAAAAAARTIRTIQPRLREIDGKLWLDTGEDPAS
ncbi:NUDIX domain-containing protein [Leucobacter sp. UT-8R-CII-1-4]|uniref:NUDIX hydrolase n=1 Tax=Leucobacter sp. UT-8R-CII-1-4 TaxID=3040075 RepID=UPI0024A824ED|nr:NUDIX domain-containing protein [Leucobacter sp. UT-8R-CII-1-4]MDI6024196.1 NUDIX domain-containing protein [Leucobacter sp. UT-8R-CII-1-4]